MNSENACLAIVTLALLGGCGGSADTVQQNRSPVLLSELTAPGTVTASETVQAIFSGKFSDYTVTRAGAGIIVRENGGANTVTMLASAQKLLFDDASVSLDETGVAAKVYRVYQAAFDRAPDLGGLGFHISAMGGAGVGLDALSQGFIDSAEFATRYGTLDNKQFLTQLYTNFLHRAPDANGIAFWLGLLNAKSITRAQVLSGFSESPENITNVRPAIENGIAYTPFTIAGAGTATTMTQASAKVAWKADGKLNLILRDARGTEVLGGHLACVAANPALLTVSPDCKNVRGHRLGEQDVLVSGDGVSARLHLKIIPQRQPLGTQGVASTYGSGAYNLVTTAAGQVLAWGGNPYGVLGQDSGLASVSLPVMVKNVDGSGHLSAIVAASAGDIDAMALTEDGEVWAWGYNAFARTSMSSRLPSLVRNPANDGSLQRIVQVSVGQTNAVALADDGTVYTWGYYAGQGTTEYASFPNYARQPSGSGALSNIAAVSAGGNFTLALGADGKVYGWGWNESGQTGRGTTTIQEALPATVKLASDDTELSNVVAISAGYRFALALTSDGKVYAWGDNGSGELGQNVRNGTYAKAVLVKDAAGTGTLGNIAMIAAGGWHALALDTAGRVHSWGVASSGQLGGGANPLIDEYNLPMSVVGTDSTGKLEGIVAIAAGKGHSLALRGDGGVLIWGDGYAGNLGQGTTTHADLAVPTPVKDAPGTGTLVLQSLTSYPNLLARGR